MAFLDFLRKKKNDSDGKDSPLASVYKEKGCYSQEYLDAFIQQFPKRNNDNLFTLCEIYTEMERYAEAKECLEPITPGSILDDITRGQLLHCRITLYMETGDLEKALSTYQDNKKFLDRFMHNPVRSKIAGDYYSNGAILSALSGDNEFEDTYIRRLREWCDLFPKNRLLLEITEVKLLLLRESGKISVPSLERKEDKEKAGDALANCRKNILDHSGFQYEWEREYYLKKLDRAARIYGRSSEE